MQNVCLLWEKEKEFRNLYSEQPFICLEHSRMLITAADRIPKKNRGEFLNTTIDLAENKLAELAGDLQHFCDMFDYRNRDSDDWGNSKDSVERTIAYLTTKGIE